MSLVLAGSRRFYVLLLFCERVSAVEAAAAPASPCAPDPRLVSAVSGCRLVRAIRLHRHWAQRMIGLSLFVAEFSRPLASVGRSR